MEARKEGVGEGPKEINDVRIGMGSRVRNVIRYCNHILTENKIRELRFSAVGGAIGKLVDAVEVLKIVNPGLFQVNKITTVSYQTVDNQGKVFNQRLYPKFEVLLTLDDPKDKSEGAQEKLGEEERLKLFELLNARESRPGVERDTEGIRGRGFGDRGRGRGFGDRGRGRGFGDRGRGFGGRGRGFGDRGRGFGDRGRGFGGRGRGRGFGVDRGFEGDRGFGGDKQEFGGRGYGEDRGDYGDDFGGDFGGRGRGRGFGGRGRGFGDRGRGFGGRGRGFGDRGRGFGDRGRGFGDRGRGGMRRGSESRNEGFESRGPNFNRGRGGPRGEY